MRFVAIRDLRSNTAALRKDLKTDHEIVVTANGRPFALITGVEPDTVEEDVMAVRYARARAAIDRMRARAKAQGLDKMTMDEIDAIIAGIRAKRREAK
jgi:antitoxin (DNA-binding transcriptional repressor) of toxin-antitoxin stability system